MACQAESQLTSVTSMLQLWMTATKLLKQTLEAYAYRVAKYIGSYVAAMNGVDAITFTAGVGENAAWLRPMVCKYLRISSELSLDEAASEKACWC